jgi:hypothetical protein
MSIPEWSFIVVGKKLFDQNNCDVENDNITIEDSLTTTVDSIKKDEPVVIHEYNEPFFYHMFRMISDFFASYEYIYALFG